MREAFAALETILHDDEVKLLSSAGRQKGFYLDLFNKQRRGWVTPRRCIYPSCGQPSIPRSHTIQRNGPLQLLAEQQHVYTPGFNPQTGQVEIERIGVRDASTFPGFCTAHEAIFADFEERGVLDQPNDMALQVFRTICREVVVKQVQIDRFDRILAAASGLVVEQGKKFLLDFLGEDFVRQHGLKDISINATTPRQDALRSKRDELKKFLIAFETDFLQPSLTEITSNNATLSHVAITVAETLPVCLAGLGNFHVLTNGRSENIQSVLNVWPSVANVLVIMTVQQRHEKEAAAYLALKLNKPLGVLTMLETWMTHGTDHWFIQPSVWERLPAARRRLVLDDILSDQFSLSDDYSRSIFDDIRRASLNLPEAARAPTSLLETEQRKLEQ